MDLIGEALRGFTCEQALSVLEANDVPAALVNHPREKVLTDPQVVHNGTVVRTHHPVGGPMQQAAPAARFDTPFAIRHHAPLIGEHNGEVLGEAGFSPEEVARLREQGVLRRDPGLH